MSTTIVTPVPTLQLAMLKRKNNKKEMAKNFIHFVLVKTNQPKKKTIKIKKMSIWQLEKEK